MNNIIPIMGRLIGLAVRFDAATVDAAGVALATIQGLNRKLTAELEQKQTEITELKQRLEKIEALLNHKLNGGAK